MKFVSKAQLEQQLIEATARIDFLQKRAAGGITRRTIDLIGPITGAAVHIAIDRPTATIRGVYVNETDALRVKNEQGTDVEAWTVQFYDEGEANQGEPLRYFIGQRVKFHAWKEGVKGTGRIVWTDGDDSQGNDKICYKISRDGFTSVEESIILIFGLEIEGLVK